MSIAHLDGRGKRILVTGGCGFVGCNIVAGLASRDRPVIAADNFSRAGAQDNADWLQQRYGDGVSIERLDVRDQDNLRSAIQDAGAVMHLAGQVAVTTSLESPLDDFEINARGTLNVLEAVRRYRPSAPVIFASTNKVYGKLLEDDGIQRRDDRCAPKGGAYKDGVGESSPIDLHSPYGCSKGAADQYVRDYARVFGLRTVVLRMSCIYGPRQFGNEDQGWIAHFLLRAIHDQPITIYGDGYQVRDALFVDDAVEAWIGALDRIEETRGRIFNLGGGPANAVSLREMLDLIAELRGEKPDIRFAAWRPGDQPWYVSDIGAIARALGWTPRTGLRDGLRALAAWLESRTATNAAPSQPLAEARA